MKSPAFCGGRGGVKQKFTVMILSDLTHLKSNARTVDDFQGIHRTVWFINKLNALSSSSFHNGKSFEE